MGWEVVLFFWNLGGMAAFIYSCLSLICENLCCLARGKGGQCSRASRPCQLGLRGVEPLARGVKVMHTDAMLTQSSEALVLQ